ncbi:hypothetical protein JKP88DRAFT_309888 [Tribonema minus]|uniref:Uncharacterized protein n=1 Tax=Tribonema minus TaxID=303371 RepID=A0A836CI96_9STRA|nr:hypothetical protein JKP88DRAFT_309888 [Tribonema minus]
MPPEPLNKDPYKCSAYRLQYTSALRPAEAQELVLQAAARVQSARAVAEAPGYVAINMPSRSCRAHYHEVAAKLRAQCGETVSLVQPEQNNRIIGQEEIRRIFAAAPAATAAPMVSLLPLSRAPGVADGAVVPVSMRGATSMSLDPDPFQAFNNQRLHDLIDNNHRPQKQWNGYIIKIYFTPLLFQLRLPDNQFQRVSYLRTTSDSVLAPDFYLFVHLKIGCKPTRDGIISFLATMNKDSMGDLCDEGWLMVTDQGGVRTLWPAASDVEVPQAVAARGFGLDNAAMLGCITEAATRNVAHAIKYGSEQQVCDTIVAFAPGAPQQALAVLKRLFVEHGADVLEKVLGRYACDAAKEEAERLRAGIAAAKREAKELQIQHSMLISDLGKLRARQHQECHTLRAGLRPRQQEAQHNDDHRSQLDNVLKEQQRLREQYDAALERCDIMQD